MIAGHYSGYIRRPGSDWIPYRGYGYRMWAPKEHWFVPHGVRQAVHPLIDKDGHGDCVSFRGTRSCFCGHFALAWDVELA